MSRIIILNKGKEYIHTYSENLRKEYEEDGWHVIGHVTGWNMSISFTG